jgi:DNA-binding NtrC family response regulator
VHELPFRREQPARSVRTLSLPEPRGGDAFVGSALATRRLREQLASAAALNCPVLVAGEPGSGRTRAALWLHAQRSARAPFVALRGLPPRAGSLLGGATLFVPELDSAALAVQQEWRAWLQQIPEGVRVVASARSAAPLENADSALFAELRRFALVVPPLRERADDFAVLAHDIAREVARDRGLEALTLTAGAIGTLRRAPWLGSAADLRRALECVAGYVPRGEPVTRSRAAAALAEVRPNVATLREAEQARERDELLAALAGARGNLARTAALLGRSRAAVYRLLAKHGVALK